MQPDGLPGGSRVRHRQDEAYPTFQPLRQCDALELSCPQLGLHVSKAPLDFHVHHIISAGQNHVRCSAIGRRATGTSRLTRQDGCAALRITSASPSWPESRSRIPSAGWRRTDRFCPTPRARRAMERRSGATAPRSMRLIIGWLMPAREARRCCVSPAARRASRTSWPNLRTTSAPITGQASGPKAYCSVTACPSARLLGCAA